MAFVISDKTQVHIAMTNFIDEARCLLGPAKKIIELRTDGGTEYTTHNLRKLLVKENILLRQNIPYNPQHNGCSERMNLEIEKKVRANLFSAKMPNYYWVHALKYVLHVHNRTPNRAIDFQTPYEKFTRRIPEVKFIRRFGCVAYVLNHKIKEESKFAARSRKAFLLECNETGYTLLSAKDKTLIRSKHVDFVESKVYGDYFGPEFSLPIDDELEFKDLNSGEKNGESKTNN